MDTEKKLKTIAELLEAQQHINQRYLDEVLDNIRALRIKLIGEKDADDN